MKNKNKYYTKKQYAFIVYDYDVFKNDYEYVKEFYNLQEIEKTFNIGNLRQYTAKSIDDIKHLVNNRYAIIKEEI